MAQRQYATGNLNGDVAELSKIWNAIRKIETEKGNELPIMHSTGNIMAHGEGGYALFKMFSSNDNLLQVMGEHDELYTFNPAGMQGLENGLKNLDSAKKSGIYGTLDSIFDYYTKYREGAEADLPKSDKRINRDIMRIAERAIKVLDSDKYFENPELKDLLEKIEGTYKAQEEQGAQTAQSAQTASNSSDDAKTDSGKKKSIADVARSLFSAKEVDPRVQFLYNVYSGMQDYFEKVPYTRAIEMDGTKYVMSNLGVVLTDKEGEVVDVNEKNKWQYYNKRYQAQGKNAPKNPQIEGYVALCGNSFSDPILGDVAYERGRDGFISGISLGAGAGDGKDVSLLVHELGTDVLFSCEETGKVCTRNMSRDEYLSPAHKSTKIAKMRAEVGITNEADLNKCKSLAQSIINKTYFGEITSEQAAQLKVIDMFMPLSREDKDKLNKYIAEKTKADSKDKSAPRQVPQYENNTGDANGTNPTQYQQASQYQRGVNPPQSQADVNNSDDMPDLPGSPNDPYAQNNMQDPVQNNNWRAEALRKLRISALLDEFVIVKCEWLTVSNSRLDPSRKDAVRTMKAFFEGAGTNKSNLEYELEHKRPPMQEAEFLSRENEIKQSYANMSRGYVDEGNLWGISQYIRYESTEDTVKDFCKLIGREIKDLQNFTGLAMKEPSGKRLASSDQAELNLLIKEKNEGIITPEKNERLHYLLEQRGKISCEKFYDKSLEQQQINNGRTV